MQDAGRSFLIPAPAFLLSESESYTYQFCNTVLTTGMSPQIQSWKNTANFIIEISQINCKTVWHMFRYFFLAWKRSPVLHGWRQLLRPSIPRCLNLIYYSSLKLCLKTSWLQTVQMFRDKKTNFRSNSLCLFLPCSLAYWEKLWYS